MRTGTKTLRALWVGCLITALSASVAVAHGGHREKIGKHGKFSSALKVEVRGAITTLTPATPTAPGSITVTAAGPTAPPAPVLLALTPGPIAVTCIIPAGADTSAFAVNDRVKAKCRSNADGLTLNRLRHKDRGDKVSVQAKGKVTAFTAATATTPGEITVDPAVTGQTPVTCAVTADTRMGLVAPVVGDTVKVACKAKTAKGAVLTAKRIMVNNGDAMGPKVEAKGTVTAVSATSITVGTVTCTVADPTVATMFPVGTFVEIHCAGDPLALTKIHLED
jgi:Domain of unknown function (DUF5666)